MKSRLAEKKDINAIVAIHLERFEHFFLSSLGSAFLHTFYTAFLRYPALLVVIEDEGEIKGFAAGSRKNKNFFKQILKNNLWNFFIAGIKIFFTRPSALTRILFNANKSEQQSIAFAELLSIATKKNKKGYGKVILKKFEEEIQKQNTENLPISLTTDYENNEKAVQFYKNCGYEILEIFEGYQNRKMYRFIKK